MPVVPAPPLPEMPRMEMLLVPELSKFTPGVKRATSEKSLTPRSSRLSWVSAVTLTGTLERLSSRRVAVTVTSCSTPVDSVAGASCARLVPGVPASSADASEAPVRITRVRRRLLLSIRRIWPPHTVFEFFRRTGGAALNHRLMPASSAQPAAHRQCAHPLAGGGVDGVAERRGGAAGAGLPHPARALAARDQVHLDPRRVRDAQRREVIKVTLLDAAVGDRDLVSERGAQAERHAALELRAHPVGVHHLAAVHRAHHTLDAHPAFGLDAHLGDLGEVAAEGELDRNAAPAARRERRAPAGAIGRELEHRAGARLFEERPAVAHRILLHRVRELVHETLHREDAAGRADAAPPAERHTRRVAPHEAHFEVLERIDEIRIRAIGGCADHIEVDALGRRRLAVVERPQPGARDGVPPGDGQAVRIERSREPVDVVGTVAVVLHVLLARPQHAHRTLDVPRDARREHDAIDLEAPAERAADEVTMHADLLRLESEGGELGDRAIAGLRPGPDFALVLAVVDGAVHRLA